MSRGLGCLQAAILATLDAAKEAATLDHGAYRGYGGEARATPWRWNRPGWVRSWGYCVQLAPDTYDLLASCRYLAKRAARIGVVNETDPAFSAAFSRAVKGLVQRGHLIPLALVPIIDSDEHARQEGIFWLSDGIYLVTHGRQVRFVQRT